MGLCAIQFMLFICICESLVVQYSPAHSVHVTKVELHRLGGEGAGAGGAGAGARGGGGGAGAVGGGCGSTVHWTVRTKRVEVGRNRHDRSNKETMFTVP